MKKILLELLLIVVLALAGVGAATICSKIWPGGAGFEKAAKK